MGYFDDIKSALTGESKAEVSPDTEYTRHRAHADFDNSPTGQLSRTLTPIDTPEQPIKKVSKEEALHPTPEKSNIPTGDIDINSGQPVGQQPVLSFNDIKNASTSKEQNRQQMLSKDLAKLTPAKPPVLDLSTFEVPAEVIHTAIANKLNAERGTKLKGDEVAKYIAEGITDPKDPIRSAVAELAVHLATDPLMYLPEIGLPTSAYKAAGKAISKGVDAVTDASKGLGVDLAAERGSIRTGDLADAFYSPTQRAIEAKLPNQATPKQVMATISNAGVSIDEAKWMDLDGFMAGKEKVSKAELVEYIKSHNVEIKEVQLDNKSIKDPTGRIIDHSTNVNADTKFQSYTLPGGTNYREVLLTLPDEGGDALLAGKEPTAGNRQNFMSSHFDQPNVLVHMRLNDRLDAEGKRTLFVEEIQSDWHQKGRNEGYDTLKDTAAKVEQLEAEALTIEKTLRERGWNTSNYPDLMKRDDWTELEALYVKGQDVHNEISTLKRSSKRGVPDAPFKKTWHELAIKRVLRMAAEEGYDRIAWTTGEQQAERYDLSKHIDKLDVWKKANGTFDIKATKDGSEVISEGGLSDTDLADTVGKDLAKKIVAGENTKPAATWTEQQNFAQSMSFAGLDLKVGGEGMKGFYDDILPRFINKYAKKWGGKVEDIQIPTSFRQGAIDPTVHSLKFTPEITRAVLDNPQSLFGGAFQTVEDHLRSMPKMMTQALRDSIPADKALSKLEEEGGYFALGPSLLIARTALGAVAGGMAGDSEDVIENALIGAGLGMFGPSLAKKLWSLMLKGEARLEEAATGRVEFKTAIPFGNYQKLYKQLVDDARRGVHHDTDVVEQGDTLAEYGIINKDSIANLYPGSSMNVDETYALHKVLTESGKNVIDLMAQVTDDATMQEYLKAFFNHGLLLDPKRLGIMAETGRAERIYGVDAPVEMQAQKAYLNQFSDLMGSMKEGMSAARFLEMSKQLKTPEQLAIFAKNAIKPEFSDAIISLWVNSLLSGPKTHVANVLGNGTSLAWAIADRQVAGLFGGEVRPGEAAAMVKGVFESFGDALQLAYHVGLEGESAMRFGGSKTGTRPRISFQDVGVTGVPGQALDYISAFFEGAGGRALLATDEFFKAIAFRAEVRARGLREAYNDVNAEGLTGTKAKDRVNELTQKYMVDVPGEIAKDAEQFAAYVTFTKNLGPTGQWLADGSTKHPAVKLIVPFVKAPINIFKFAGEHTPFALMSKSYWNDIQKGGATAELAKAKLATGSMIGGLVTLLAADGIITGGGPNPKQFKELNGVMMENKWQAYSVNVSALKRKAKGESTAWQKGDNLVSYNRIEPLGMLFGMYANYVEIASNADKDDSYEELANTLLMATVKVGASKTFIKGLSQTALAFAYPEEFLGDTTSKFLTGFVPIFGSSLSRQVAQTVDPVMREAEGFVENLRKNTPGLSSKLPATLHPISGEPVYRQGGLGPDIASPLYQSVYKKDAVLDEIIKNKVNIPRHGDNIHGVELSPEGKNELHTIITQQVKMGGRNLYESLAHLMDSSTYKHGTEGPDGRRAVLIKSLVHAFSEKGELMFLKKYPDVRQSMKDLQREHADKMKSVRNLPSDEAIEAGDTEIPDVSVAGQ